MSDLVYAGICRACGRDLVYVFGERTYHPAAVLGPGESCPALLPIPGTDLLSNDVPYSQFAPPADPASRRASAGGEQR